MRIKILARKNIGRFLQNLMREYRVMAPVPKDGIIAFEWLSDPEELSLVPGQIPRLSAKKALLPQTEPILYYRLGKNTESATPPPLPSPRVLFGLHPCDVQAIKTLDAVFGADPEDELYMARRKMTTIVGLGATPEKSPDFSFFEQIGISSMDSEGCDLFLAEINDKHWTLEILTEKGENAAEFFPDLSDADEDDRAELQKRRDSAGNRASGEYSAEKLADRDLMAAFELDVWTQPGNRCVGCGACTFLCPTCHCFDVQDETCRDLGCRARTWDTCQFDLFTKHASGHNPRALQDQRVRQRVLHKFAYGPENFQLAFCVGCGRCLAVCPVGNNIRETLEKLLERSVDESEEQTGTQ